MTEPMASDRTAPMAQPTDGVGTVVWRYLRVAHANCSMDADAALTCYLEEGWEPFAVTQHNGDQTVHLRRIEEGS